MQVEDLKFVGHGLIFCSVCVPEDASIDEIERLTNLKSPTGCSTDWRVSDHGFRTGEPNPCVCNEDPDRLHYLMNC